MRRRSIRIDEDVMNDVESTHVGANRRRVVADAKSTQMAWAKDTCTCTFRTIKSPPWAGEA